MIISKRTGEKCSEAFKEHVAFCIAVTIATSSIAPSQIRGNSPPVHDRNELATARREVGRVGRSLFIIDGLLAAELQRRAQIRAQQGCGPPCAEANIQPPSSWRNPRPFRLRSTLSDRRHEPARRDHHLPEHHEVDRRHRQPEKRVKLAIARSAGSCLAVRREAYQSHRRTSLARTLT